MFGIENALFAADGLAFAVCIRLNERAVVYKEKPVRPFLDEWRYCLLALQFVVVVCAVFFGKFELADCRMSQDKNVHSAVLKLG